MSVQTEPTSPFSASAGSSSGRRATSAIRRSSITSRWSPSWPGWASARTASRPPPTAPRRRSGARAGTRYLALVLALLTALTVLIISAAYCQHHRALPGRRRRLPGGHQAARRPRRRRLGLRAAGRLRPDHHDLVAGGGDSSSASCRPAWQPLKLPAEFVVLVLLIVLNLRGVKESVQVLAPIFLALPRHPRPADRRRAPRARATRCPSVVARRRQRVHDDGRAARAGWPLLLHLPARLLARRRHLHRHRGGLQRPRRSCASRASPPASGPWLYMAVSLAFTAGGILLGYLLTDARTVEAARP